MTQQELLATVWFSEHFKHYLVSQKFLLRTDHGSLRWLFSFKEPEGQMARWLERLARFQFDIEHHPGRKHGNSDGMSRIPCEGRCRNCAKGHETTAGRTEVARTVRSGHRKKRGRTGRIRKLKGGSEVVTNDWMSEIRSWQEADPDLPVLGTWRERPNWAEIARERPELKYYWEQLKQQDGL